jgi:hypothetical protein
MPRIERYLGFAACLENTQSVANSQEAMERIDNADTTPPNIQAMNTIDAY